MMWSQALVIGQKVCLEDSVSADDAAKITVKKSLNGRSAVNSKKCSSCGELMKRNGRTKAGAPSGEERHGSGRSGPCPTLSTKCTASSSSTAYG